MRLFFSSFLVIIITGISAQPEIDLSGKTGGGFEWNIFNAPQEYIRPNGNYLGSDSLLQNTAFAYFEAEFDFEWKLKKAELSWMNDVELIRYDDLTQANATELQTRLRYDRKAGSRIEYGGELRLRSQDRLGINVLGSELLTPFSFRQVELSGNVSKESKKEHLTYAEANFSYKNYDECENCGLEGESVSLTQSEFEFTLGQELKINSGSKMDQELDLSFRFRHRDYYDWLNYDILADEPDPVSGEPFIEYSPALDYPLRTWRYIIFKLAYSMDLNEYVKMKPQIEYTRRFDLSNGDFGFNQLQPGLYLYLNTEKWEGRMYLSYTSRDYTDRVARQNEGPPLPLLEYRYLRTKFRVIRELSKGFSIWAEFASSNRESNTTEVTTRVRRSYQNSAVMGGIMYQFEKKPKRR